MNAPILLAHNRVELALHTLRSTPAGRPLLLLHGLGERSPEHLPEFATDWPGPVFALDFTGHGESSIPHGGGYTAEILMADVDIALAHLGRATIVGRGMGAYIGLLIAGARPQLVIGTVLADGSGMAGGATEPTSLAVINTIGGTAAPDPYALLEMGRDLRPSDYSPEFAQLASVGSDLDEPITIAARFRPAWLQAVATERGVATAPTIAEALAPYANVPHT